MFQGQNGTFKLPSGEQAKVIYPNGKIAVNFKYQPMDGNVVVYYAPPNENDPDIADPVNGDPLLFIVPEAIIGKIPF